jgi:hypothetical protein
VRTSSSTAVLQGLSSAAHLRTRHAREVTSEEPWSKQKHGGTSADRDDGTDGLEECREANQSRQVLPTTTSSHEILFFRSFQTLTLRQLAVTIFERQQMTVT